MLIEYHFVQKLYFQSSLITDYNLGEEPTFLKHRDILNAMLFGYILMRLIASFFGGWDFGSFSRSEYILYILAALSMFIASISKSVGPHHTYPVEDYSQCTYLDRTTGRIVPDIFETKCLTACDVAIYTSVLVFLASVLVLFIYKLICLFKGQREVFEFESSEEELKALKN